MNFLSHIIYFFFIFSLYISLHATKQKNAITETNWKCSLIISEQQLRTLKRNPIQKKTKKNVKKILSKKGMN